MASTTNLMPSNGKTSSFDRDSSHIDASDNRYSDLNLNQCKKTFKLYPVMPHGTTAPIKLTNSTLFEDCGKKFQTCEKSSKNDLCFKFSNFLSFNDKSEKDEAQKCWKKEKNSKNFSNNGMLSLQIAAYENDTEDKAVAPDLPIMKIFEMKPKTLNVGFSTSTWNVNFLTTF